MCWYLINSYVRGAAVLTHPPLVSSLLQKPHCNPAALPGGYCTFRQNIIKSKELLFPNNPGHKSTLTFCSENGEGLCKWSLRSHSQDRLCLQKEEREKRKRRGKEKSQMAKLFRSLIDLIWTSLAATIIWGCRKLPPYLIGGLTSCYFIGAQLDEESRTWHNLGISAPDLNI